MQIFLENVIDLLEPENKVVIREGTENEQCIENCIWIKVKNSEECLHAFQIGVKNRYTALTRANVHCSRSHAILIVQISKKENDDENNAIEGNLYIVDLAGMERSDEK